MGIMGKNCSMPVDLAPTVANSPPLLLISRNMSDVATQTKSFLSGKVAHFTESVIREMTRKAMMYDAVNLAQGFPDFPAPAEIKRAAQEAIAADINQYAITWGAKSLRNAIARKFQEWLDRGHRFYFAGGVQCGR